VLRLGYINLGANGIASIPQGSVIAFFGDWYGERISQILVRVARLDCASGVCCLRDR